MLFFRPRSAVDGLLSGYRRFRRTTYAKDRRLYRRLTNKGQRPKVMIIACSDSRVSPTAILATHPGDVFIARNVANIVPPYDPDAKPRSIGAAVEYAIKVLKIEHIVILGHANCGGVAALVDGGKDLPPTDYLRAWVDVAAPALEYVHAHQHGLKGKQLKRLGEEAVVRLSMRNLENFPWVRERIEAGKLEIHGWHFDMLEGCLSALDPALDSFETVPVR